MVGATGIEPVTPSMSTNAVAQSGLVNQRLSTTPNHRELHAKPAFSSSTFNLRSSRLLLQSGASWVGPIGGWTDTGLSSDSGTPLQPNPFEQDDASGQGNAALSPHPVGVATGAAPGTADASAPPEQADPAARSLPNKQGDSEPAIDPLRADAGSFAAREPSAGEPLAPPCFCRTLTAGMKAHCTRACSEDRLKNPEGADAATTLLWIRTDRIRIGDRLRGLDELVVEFLRSSILDRGVIQAITVMADPENPGHYILIAGWQRLEAVIRAGLSMICCHVVEVSETERQLIELDENLGHADLTTAERSLALYKRKGIYESRHGRAKARGAHAANSAMGNSHDANAIMAESFASGASRLTQTSQRQVQRLLGWATSIGPDDLRRLARTSLDCGVEIEALARLAPEARKSLIEMAAAGKNVSARASAAATQAKTTKVAAEVPAAPQPEPVLAADLQGDGSGKPDDPQAPYFESDCETVSEEIDALKVAWRRASATSRAAFLAWVSNGKDGQERSLQPTSGSEHFN
jgi:ParB-like nuclease domain